jgi:hypothetical protein
MELIIMKFSHKFPLWNSIFQRLLLIFRRFLLFVYCEVRCLKQMNTNYVILYNVLYRLV